MVIRTEPRLLKPFRNVPVGIRPILLEADNGAPGGAGATTTTNPAITTGGGQEPNTQAGGGGAATGAVTTSQAATTTPTATGQAPKFTDDDMAAARGAWQAEQDRKVAEAARLATEQEAIEQGKAKDIAAERLKTIHELEARVTRMEPVLLQNLDEMTKDWPPAILGKKPSEGGYEARLAWYENNKDVAAEFIKLTTQNTQSNYGGNGYQPNPPGNGGGNMKPVDSYVANTYGKKK